MSPRKFADLLRAEPELVSKFSYIDPPFDFNAPDVSKYPPEVTGQFLLKSLCRRLNWPSLTRKRLLDFGCGVRFARAIVNLGIDIELYVGVDTNEKPISWLRSNVNDTRLRFEHLNMRNAMYNPGGTEFVDAGTLERIGLIDFDAACMFSVITHQAPEEAEKIFSMLYRCVSEGGSLYFTAFIDDAVDRYIERDPASKGLLSTYHPDRLVEITEGSGWIVCDVFPCSPFQQTAFVCRKQAARS
jgi:SAM-dependent methyltransferase